MQYITGTFRKSSYSGGTDAGGCLEAAASGKAGCHVAVRDSKDPQGGQLMFGAGPWRAFVAGVTA